jgi:glucans biosynthesis protein C
VTVVASTGHPLTASGNQAAHLLCSVAPSCRVIKEDMPTETTSTVAATAFIPQKAPKPRLDFVDNLRSVMIILVVSMHAAVTYSHVGGWYFMEDPKPGTVVLAVFATYQIFLQAFFMGLLFLLAGYFVPSAFDRKGFAGFVRERLVRLGLPSLFFMLIIQPFTVYWLLRNFANPEISSLTAAYWPYIRSGRFLGGSGPMWFAVALLLFSLLYAGLRLVHKGAARNEPDATLPNNRHIVCLALLIGVCAFLVRTIQPIGTNILNMQLCFFSQYVILFCVGIYARRRNWLLRMPYSFGMRWFRWTAFIGSILWVALLAALLTTHAKDKLEGGWTWQSAAFSFWESFFSVGISLGLLVLFREKLNHPGKLQRWLSENSFAVYMFHTPILIAVTFLLRGVDAPKLLKFAVATVLAVTATFAASSLVFRRIPILKRIL